jgi:hypothetical protein
MSMAPSCPLEKCIGDCDSGVETAPKLEMERGESSAERLRLKPILWCCSLFESVEVAGFGLCRMAVMGSEWRDGMVWE